MEKRLQYIGSKYQLIDWLFAGFQEITGWTDWTDKTVADLFAGTGIVSYNLAQRGATVVNNDAELYSSIISECVVDCPYLDKYEAILADWNTQLESGLHISTVGAITTHYSPWGVEGRMFFTEDNARRIDYIRSLLFSGVQSGNLDRRDFTFLMSSLLVSADAVSNCASVYGAYLKAFKGTAQRALVLTAIHRDREVRRDDSTTFNRNVLDAAFLEELRRYPVDLVYLDPPYNNRQYSKNYFPLNIIAQSDEACDQRTFQGKTGIPDGCFVSSFCTKRDVERSFQTLIRNLDAPIIAISYNSESLIPRDRMLEILSEYGEAGVLTRDYKRYKSNHNTVDATIEEYLFYVKK